MKASEVYREAAREMEMDGGFSIRWKYSCLAIEEVQGACESMTWTEASNRYRSVMGGPGVNLQHRFEACEYPHAVRILALCFMAAIAESEGD